MLKRIKQIKAMLALIVFMSLLTISVTYAYIMTSTNEAKNTFYRAYVQSEVHEEFDGSIKQNVTIKNLGNVDAYIRTMIVVNWMDDEGNIFYLKPQENIDYEISFNDQDWTLGDDGFWYYHQKVSSFASTTNLINRAICIASDIPDGYQLSIEVISSAIQSEPDETIETQWHVDIVDDILVCN